ncbi:MAG: DNA polymerase III subunit beta [Janthinobacterium lividum]
MAKSKFIVSSAAFAKALAQVVPVIAGSPIVPILENVLLVGTGSVVGTAATVQLVGTNFETLLSVTLAVEGFENFALCVPARKLLSTLKGFPDAPITCEVDDEVNTFELSAGRSRYKLAGELPHDFPKMKPVERKPTQFSIPSNLLRAALAATLETAATNDQRTYFNAVLIEATASELRFVGCDGHTIAIYDITDEDERFEEVEWEGTFKLLVPRGSAQLLLNRLDAKSSALLTLLADSTNIRLQDGGWVSRLVDETYADYRGVLPGIHPQILDVDRDELLAALRRLTGYTPEKTDMAVFSLTQEVESFTIRADSPDWGNEGSEEVGGLFEGQPLTIGFPAARLAQLLSLWPSGKIRFSMDGSSRAALLTLAQEEDAPVLTCLVMPSVMLPAALAA